MEALLLLLVWTVPSGAEEWLCKGLDNPIDLNYHMIQLTGCRDHKPDLETPLVAMTPEVFLRFAASHRYFNKERDCQTGMFQTSGHEFKSRNWRFCVAGKCDPSLKECRCYDHFAGPRCDQFVGNCWMIYCYLHKCEVGFDSLNCECNRDLFHKPTLSGKYFYPDGPSDTFLPPPPSFREVIEPFSLPVISDYYLAPGLGLQSSVLENGSQNGTRVKAQKDLHHFLLNVSNLSKKNMRARFHKRLANRFAKFRMWLKNEDIKNSTAKYCFDMLSKEAFDRLIFSRPKSKRRLAKRKRCSPTTFKNKTFTVLQCEISNGDRIPVNIIKDETVPASSRTPTSPKSKISGRNRSSIAHKLFRMFPFLKSALEDSLKNPSPGSADFRSLKGSGDPDPAIVPADFYRNPPRKNQVHSLRNSWKKSPILFLDQYTRLPYSLEQMIMEAESTQLPGNFEYSSPCEAHPLNTVLVMDNDQYLEAESTVPNLEDEISQLDLENLMGHLLAQKPSSSSNVTIVLNPVYETVSLDTTTSRLEAVTAKPFKNLYTDSFIMKLFKTFQPNKLKSQGMGPTPGANKAGQIVNTTPFSEINAKRFQIYDQPASYFKSPLMLVVLPYQKIYGGSRVVPKSDGKKILVLQPPARDNSAGTSPSYVSRYTGNIYVYQGNIRENGGSLKKNDLSGVTSNMNYYIAMDNLLIGIDNRSGEPKVIGVKMEGFLNHFSDQDKKQLVESIPSPSTTYEDLDSFEEKYKLKMGPVKNSKSEPYQIVRLENTNAEYPKPTNHVKNSDDHCHDHNAVAELIFNLTSIINELSKNNVFMVLTTPEPSTANYCPAPTPQACAKVSKFKVPPFVMARNQENVQSVVILMDPSQANEMSAHNDQNSARDSINLRTSAARSTTEFAPEEAHGGQKVMIVIPTPDLELRLSDASVPVATKSRALHLDQLSNNVIQWLILEHLLADKNLSKKALAESESDTDQDLKTIAQDDEEEVMDIENRQSSTQEDVELTTDEWSIGELTTEEEVIDASSTEPETSSICLEKLKTTTETTTKNTINGRTTEERSTKRRPNRSTAKNRFGTFLSKMSLPELKVVFTSPDTDWLVVTTPTTEDPDLALDPSFYDHKKISAGKKTLAQLLHLLTTYTGKKKLVFPSTPLPLACLISATPDDLSPDPTTAFRNKSATISAVTHVTLKYADVPALYDNSLRGMTEPSPLQQSLDYYELS